MSSTPILQVGGHPSTLKSSSSSPNYVLKPSLQREIDFYTSVLPRLTKKSSTLLEGRWVPTLGGIITPDDQDRDGQDEQNELGEHGGQRRHVNASTNPIALHPPSPSVDPSHPDHYQDHNAIPSLTLDPTSGLLSPPIPSQHQPHQSQPPQNPHHHDSQPSLLKLENLIHPFSHPNVLDLKLGTQFWDEESSLDKRERMEKASLESTSWETGVRVTGMGLYDPLTQTYFSIPKSYGKNLKPSELPQAIRKFFPIPSSDQPPECKSSTLIVVKSILARTKTLIEIVNKLPIRMRGGSVLVIWEADPSSLQIALDQTPKDQLDSPGPSTKDLTPEEIKKRPFDIRLIDFAHVKEVPDIAQEEGKDWGPDPGILKGLRTLEGLLEGWVKEVEG